MSIYKSIIYSSHITMVLTYMKETYSQSASILMQARSTHEL